MECFPFTLHVLGLVFVILEVTGQDMKAQKTHLKAVSVLTPPFLMKDEFGHYKGYVVDLVDRLTQIIGVTNITIHEPSDSRFGSKNKDGTWDGMIGELINEQADAAIGPLTITSQRERVVDFTKPFMSTGITMVAKRRARVPYNDLVGNTVFLFLKPLHAGVWVIIIIAYVVTSLLVGIMERLIIKSNEPSQRSICLGFWWCVQAFTLQGFFKGPSAVAARTLLVFWFAFSAISVSMYIASMVNFLGAEADLLENLTEGVRPQYVTRAHPIKSADQIAKQTNIKYGMVREGSTHEFFRVTNVKVYEDLYDHMSADDAFNLDTVTEGMERVRSSSGQYIFFCESALADYFMRQPPCDVESLGAELHSAGYGIATPLSSQFRDVFSFAVLSLRESGALQDLERKWFSNKCQDEGYTLEVGNDKGLILGGVVYPKQFAGVAVLLLLGMIVAAIVAAVEYSMTRPNQKEPEETQLNSGSNCTDEKA